MVLYREITRPEGEAIIGKQVYVFSGHDVKLIGTI